MGGRIKQGARDSTVGAVKFAGRSALSVGRGAIGFMDYSTFDVQGKRAESDAFFADLNDRDAAFHTHLAIMDKAAREQQGAWNQHMERERSRIKPQEFYREEQADDRADEGPRTGWAHGVGSRIAQAGEAFIGGNPYNAFNVANLI